MNLLMSAFPESPAITELDRPSEEAVPNDRIVRIGIGAAVFVLPLALYLRTLCPTVYPGDGAELTAASWCLGVAHPTGYPLFTVLGHLFQRLGLGSPAFSMNLMCALFGALACVATYRLQRELWRSLFGRAVARQPVARCVAATVALALGVSATWWGHSTMTEVYTLMLVLVAWAWAAGLRLVRRPTQRGLWTLALLSGIGFLHHQIFLITLPLSCLGLVRFLREKQPTTTATTPDETPAPDEPKAKPNQNRTRAVWIAVLLFLIPLIGYAYLPIRAATLPAINSGNPRGIGGIVQHLTGKQFRQTRILAHPNGQQLAVSEIAPHIQSRLAEILRWVGEQYVAPRWMAPKHGQPHDATVTPADRARAPVLACIFIFLAILGGAALYRREPFAALGLGAGLLLNLVIVVVYTIPDIDAYQMPLMLALGSLAAVGPVGVGVLVQQEGPSRHAKRAWGTALAALALALFGVWNWYAPERGVNKANANQADVYARELMKALPENAVVFTTGDWDIYPLWYLQVCEGARPDVAVVGSNFVFSRWYEAPLRATLPEGVEVFVGDEPPSTSARWLLAFLGGMVAPQIEAGHPVYLTIFQHQAELQLIREFGQFELEPVLSFPSPTPWPTPPLVAFRVTDPNGFAPRAIQTFREAFPMALYQTVRGRDAQSTP